MVGLFAIFSSAPRVLAESFGFSPIMLGLLFAGVVFVVFGAGMLATRISARLGLYRATTVGLGITVVGGIALLGAVLVARDSFPPFLAATAIFLFGLGIASPLSSAAALSPFGNKAGVAAALLGFTQMAGGGGRDVAGGGHLQRSGARACHRADTGHAPRIDPVPAGRTALSLALTQPRCARMIGGPVTGAAGDLDAHRSSFGQVAIRADRLAVRRA
jgi:hypothetical protein